MNLLSHALTLLWIAFPGMPLDEMESSRAALALETIDAEDISAYIGYMAADAQYGRNAGSKENLQVTEWLAGFFKRAGLKPGGEAGTYFQNFTFRPGGSKDKEAQTRNVIAIWEGSDPVLKKQAIVVGGHMDHVGFKGGLSNPGRLGRGSKDDLIWNGADDNASGTAAVLEIAQAFATARPKTARSVVFILFNAEEHGLHGSRHYVNNPVFPLEKTTAMINLDMIGRNSEDPVYLLGAESADGEFLRNLAIDCAEYIPDFQLSFTRSMFNGSDHAPFLKKQIPAAFFFSGLHRDYHQIGDEADKIDCTRVMNVAKIAFLMLFKLANTNETIEFNPIYKPGVGGYNRKRLLGIDVGKKVNPQELEGLGLDANQGAVRVDSVYKEMPAWTAGLKGGDLILSIGGKKIEKTASITSLREALDSVPPQEDVPIQLVRKGAILQLSLRWEK